MKTSSNPLAQRIARRLVHVTMAAAVIAALINAQSAHAATPVAQLPTVTVVAKRAVVAQLPTVVVVSKRVVPATTFVAERETANPAAKAARRG